MNILGVSNTHDSGACLMVDGQLVAAANEERFIREKLTHKFPYKSIEWLLCQHGLKPADIDVIGSGHWKGIESWNGFPAYLDDAMTRVRANPAAHDVIMARVRGSISSDSRQLNEWQTGLAALGFADTARLTCDHHHAHAVAAFEFSPFDRALVVTLDGRGDFMSGSVSRWARGQEPTLLRTELELDSLGAFYGWITQFLGFIQDRHEGKVTGLAGRGHPEVCGPILRQGIAYADGRIQSTIGTYYAPYMRAELPELRRLLAPYSREDVAAGAQAVLEEVTSAYVAHYLRQTGERNLCLAGGVFGNVLLNLRLRELPGVESCFVFPHMGDGGIAVGGAAYTARRLGAAIQPLSSAYLGPAFDADRCRRAITEAGFAPEQPADLADQVAAALDKGTIVGVFQGRMEYGPRALGNRSILARTIDATINESLNRRLSRSEFMPFAPVTLADHAADCYEGWTPRDPTARYMTCCFRCTPRMRAQSPAVVHVDGTARPQIITRADNAFYYDVLHAYYRRTGIPSVVNTSFNEHEAPIVCEPEQAVEGLTRKAIDLLAMPPFLVRLHKDGN